MELQQNINSVIRLNSDGSYTAECVDLSVVTQGNSSGEVFVNLVEAVKLHLEGEDLEELGLAPSPNLVVSVKL